MPVLFSLDDKSTVGSVKLKGGQTLPADVVVLGVGVGPQTDYLKNSPDFTLEKDGSLKVDQHFKVEGFDHIYATGKAHIKLDVGEGQLY
jgi:pyruvate/2-oxoglutarate dehydrogenase complex dihydrolipoamide dehydrogenase (E3) component